jgi:uncharacterized protein YjiS (DUF1127 family)
MNIKKRQDINVLNIDELFEDMDEDRVTPGQAILNAWLKVKDWREVSRQRRDLRDLSDQLLKDIGISRADAIREADRTFWDKKPNFDVSLRKRGESNDTFESESSKLTCCVQS